MIEEYCKACKAVGSAAYRTICDKCKEVIPDSEESVLLHTGLRQIQLHVRCAGEGGVECTICHRRANMQGVVVHDAAAHLGIAGVP